MAEPFVIIRCNKLQCGRFTYCKSSQKTKKCPYCGKRLKVEKERQRFAKTTIEARKMVQEFNKRLGKITEPSWYKSENGTE
ncbi:MAG: DUF1922 domain-containing protein [Candidatus Heimdallarchaeota archaeon]|nr:DUF1922 domain-containing protein [Candidatus Heimdallarchaeota archaeon]MCK4955354.1 DUF1922 domain-containing protein [Candidatus Heimdallarchaeota archaeon]